MQWGLRHQVLYRFLGGGKSTFFYVHPDPWGNGIQFDEHVFHMGWFNHHLEILCHLFFTALPPVKKGAKNHICQETTPTGSFKSTKPNPPKAGDGSSLHGWWWTTSWCSWSVQSTESTESWSNGTSFTSTNRWASASPFEPSNSSSQSTDRTWRWSKCSSPAKWEIWSQVFFRTTGVAGTDESLEEARGIARTDESATAAAAPTATAPTASTSSIPTTSTVAAVATFATFATTTTTTTDVRELRV